MFVISDITKLRVYVNVPQNYVPSIRIGAKAVISVPEYPTRTFDGDGRSLRAVRRRRLGHDADAAWPRQCQRRADAGQLCQCAASALQRDSVPLSIPASALIFNQNGLRVATVGPDDKILFKTVTISRDLGRTIELASGLSADDRVVVTPPDGIADGDPVRVAGAQGQAAREGVREAGREGIAAKRSGRADEVVQCAVSFSGWSRWHARCSVRSHRRLTPLRTTSGSGRSASSGMPPISKRKRSCSARSSQGLRELGYVEGRNVVFEHTFVDEKYELFPSRAQELLDRKVDVILASVGAAAVAASKLTKDVPIVFATSSGDPAKIGLVESIRRPGGNLTGLTLFAPEMTLKHLELIREIVPKPVAGRRSLESVQ